MNAPNANSMTFEKLMTEATELGKQAGQGKDVQIKFDLKLLEAAFQGNIDLDENKHGSGVSDAVKLSETYVKSQGTATIFDAKAPNQRKLISNVNKCIKLGMWPKGGPGEPLQTVNNLIALRQKLRQDPANAKKLDDAHNTLMRFATRQLKQDQLIGGEELKLFCFKSEADARSAEDVLVSVRKTLSNLIVGKVSNCPDLDDSPEVKNMVQLVTKRLTVIAKAKAPQSSAPATPTP